MNDARARTDRLKSSSLLAPASIDLAKEIRAAYRRQDWRELGYASWEAYVAAEFSAQKLGVSAAARDRISPWFDEDRLREGAPDRRSVYFIQAATGGLIKIGVAANVATRLSTIQLMCPVPLVVLATIPGVGRAGEAQLHQRFADARHHGEWFEPTAELLSYVAEVGGRS